MRGGFFPYLGGLYDTVKRRKIRGIRVFLKKALKCAII